MASVHTLYSEPTNAKKFQGYGYKLDSRERELESQCNELLVETKFFANKCSEFRNAKVLAEARSDMLNKELEKKNDKILSFQEEIDQLINAKNKGDLNIKQFKKEIKQLKKEIKRFKKEIIDEPTNAKKFQGYGYKLDSRERELESQCNELLVETKFFANKCSEFRNAKVLAEARSDMLNKELEKKNDKILSFQEEIDQLINTKNKGDLNIKQFKKEINQLKKEIKRFKKEIIELQNKNTSLISQDTLKELSLTGYRAKYYAKMEEANSLQSKIKLLEEKLFSACEDVSKKEFDILSLNSKINELDQQKSKAMTSILSNQVELLSKPIIGGDDEKIHKAKNKNKIDINHIPELPKIDTLVHEEVVSSTPEFSKTNISPDDIHISSDMPLSIPKSVTSYFAQRENSEASIKTHNTPSLIESHPQIPIEGIGAMRSSLEALPLPIMASSLMSPLSAYMLLTLLIIAVIWFVILRRELDIGKKSGQLRDMWNSNGISVKAPICYSWMRFCGDHKFKKPDIITLELEPSNTYDKNAIKVMVDGIHKAYVAKNENVSIGDLMKKYPNYRITAHGKKNYNQSASLNLEYPWMIIDKHLRDRDFVVFDFTKAPLLYTDRIVTNSFMVVGMRFRGGHKFKKPDIITLELEPSNTYDKNAIKVMVDGIHKAYVAKNENVSIGDLMKKYPNYRITAHGKKNYNQSASLNLEYPWMVCGSCHDTLLASRDYDYTY
ncbi:hypothetical protein Glove_78g205 [Diversispora epigaea]|uniref:HIRAN domain-containing protein n=1 Tax=Diversispora epigaea TaxID=1348612 RepID=A0A397JC68_9GLOM|nr:hypothetical protein Glove_78g205 [Diversispora epigaea]